MPPRLEIEEVVVEEAWSELDSLLVARMVPDSR